MVIVPEFKYLPDREYFELDGISNSRLSCLVNGPEHYLIYKDKEKEKKEYYAFGSLFHCLLLEAQEFTNRYYIVDESIDIPDFKNQAGRAINLAVKQNLFTDNGEIITSDLDILHAQLGIKLSKQKLLDKMMKYSEYIEVLINSKDKETVSIYQLDNANKCVSSVKNNKRYNDFFNKTLDDKAFNEYFVLFEELGLLCKGKIDRCIIDKKKKKLVLLDLKTTGKPLNYFSHSYKSFHYYRQLAFYLNGLFKYLGIDWNDLKGWQVEVYILAVESNSPYCSRFYPVEWCDLLYGKSEYEYWLTNLKWYIDNDVWIEKAIYEGNGLGKPLGLFKEEINDWSNIC